VLKNKSLRPRQMKLLLDELPKANQYVLYFIIQHLVNVAKHDAENKMGVNNLAIVFGPTLFRSRDESPVRLLSDVAFLRGCVETFIKDYEIVFSSIIPSNERLHVSEDQEMRTLLHQASDDARRERSRDSPNGNRDVQLNGSYDNLLDDSPLKRRGVSMNDSESLTQERNHLRFLLDKIAEDTKREESEAATHIGKKVMRDLDANIKRFEQVDKQMAQANLEDQLQQKQQEKVDRRESTSPSDTHKETEEDFVRSLSEVHVDLTNPLAGISERIFRRMKRDNLPINQTVQSMTLQELYDEKSILKRELRFYDELFKNVNGREPDKSQKEPLRQVYNRYKEVRTVIPQRERAAYRKAQTLSSVPTTGYVPSPRLSGLSSSTATDSENYIGPNSPLYGMTNIADQQQADTRASTGSQRAKSVEYQKQSPRSIREINSDLPVPKRISNDNIGKGSSDTTTTTTSDKAMNILLENNAFIELRKEKKILQRQLHQFQNEFTQKNGRKVTTKSDRAPMDKEYRRYKEVKNLMNQMILDAEAKCS
jgi:tetrahydromethanopterin S-methyltransferase subunit G